MHRRHAAWAVLSRADDEAIRGRVRGRIRSLLTALEDAGPRAHAWPRPFEDRPGAARYAVGLGRTPPDAARLAEIAGKWLRGLPGTTLTRADNGDVPTLRSTTRFPAPPTGPSSEQKSPSRATPGIEQPSSRSRKAALTSRSALWGRSLDAAGGHDPSAAGEADGARHVYDRPAHAPTRPARIPGARTAADERRDIPGARKAGPAPAADARLLASAQGPTGPRPSLADGSRARGPHRAPAAPGPLRYAIPHRPPGAPGPAAAASSLPPPHSSAPASSPRAPSPPPGAPPAPRTPPPAWR